jgi:hypothetical protein
MWLLANDPHVLKKDKAVAIGTVPANCTPGDSIPRRSIASNTQNPYCVSFKD